jgi:type I restriction enzyme R subunit
MDLKMKHSEIYNTLSSYQSKYLENKDTQNRELAYTKIFSEVMQQQRRNELELYKKIAQDDAFKQAMQDTIKRLLMVG